eukprot:536757-Amphidinium_carterae.2
METPVKECFNRAFHRLLIRPHGNSSSGVLQQCFHLQMETPLKECFSRVFHKLLLIMHGKLEETLVKECFSLKCLVLQDFNRLTKVLFCPGYFTTPWASEFRWRGEFSSVFGAASKVPSV